MDKFSLCLLPTEILIKISSLLCFTDLVNLGLTCRRFYEICRQDSLWRPLCEEEWATKERCSLEEPWRDHFVHFYKQFGRYLGAYPKLKTALDKLEAYLRENLPQLPTFLREGATEEDLDKMEDRLAVNLPKEVRCFYRLCDGQDPESIFGLFGNVAAFQDITNTEVFLGSKMVFKPYVLFNSPTEELAYQMCFNRELNSPDRPHCIAISQCPNTYLKICVTVDDFPGLKKGSMFHLADHQRESFYIGPSLVSWFCRYVEQMVAGEFIIKNNIIYRMYGHHTCRATTANIRVSVATAFLPDKSKVSKYFFSYHITMEMFQSVQFTSSYQLQTRHWFIVNERGEEEYVEGPGVVGQFPVMKPGSQHTWVSSTILKTPSGYMQGYFTMVNLINSSTIQVECPRFYLKAPPMVKLHNCDDLEEYSSSSSSE